MRILIVGAGIAGLTLAALLKRRGFSPTIVEKQYEISNIGHMLGIYPLGSKVLYGLGLMQEFLDRSVPSDHYMLCTSNGDVIHHFSLKQTFDPYGPNRSCTRGALIDVLLQGCDDIPILMGVEVTSLDAKGDVVEVTLSDNSQEEYDLVVGADGIHSHVRDLILTPEEYSIFDTGWGGWVWWTDDPKLTPGTAIEFWGSGHMLGIYPTEYKFGAFAISSSKKGKTTPYSGLRSDIRQEFSDLIKPYPVVFEQIPMDSTQMTYWPLKDVRSEVWHRKNVVLIGDAAVGFLPTSDAGASMAMESAAVLADELTRTDRYHLDWALQLFEKRRKPRVQAAQDDSRNLAKHMFVKSILSSQIRNFMLRKQSVKSLSESIDKTFQTPI